MADRYAVATGNWNDNNTWSATDGGAAGASFPTSADNTFLTAASGVIVVTVNVESACLGLTCTGYTGTLTVNAQFNINASVVWVAAMTINGSNISLQMTATSGSHTITSNTKTLPGAFTLGGNGAGATWTLVDALNTTATLTISGGTFATANQTVTCQAFVGSGSVTRTITLGSSTINVSRVWQFTTTTNLTFTANTATINLLGTLSTPSFLGGGLTYNIVNLTCGTTITATIAITGANTFGTLTIVNVDTYSLFSVSANQIVSGTLTITGNNASTRRLYIASSAIGTARTITAAVVSLANVDFEDITAAGAASPFTGTLLGDGGGNTNITTDTPITTYWVHAGADSRAITDALWFTASGGAVAARFPLPQDTAIFDANSFGAASKIVTAAITGLRLPGVNWTGVTNNPQFNVTALTNYYGSIILATAGTMTMNGSASARATGRGSYTLNINITGPLFTLTLAISAVGGTYTLATTFASAAAMNINAGTFTTANFNVTCLTTNSSATGFTRAINMGSSTWTLTSTGTVWTTATGAPDLTLNAGTSTIAVTNASASAKVLDFGTETVNSVTLNGAGAGAYTIQGACTIGGTLTVSNTGGASATIFGAASMTIKNIVFTGFTGTWAGSTAGTISGSLTLATGMTNSYTGALTFSATTTATITSATKAFASAMTFNGVGGTWTLQDTFSNTSTITLTNGILNANNFGLTCSTFASSNANTRQIQLGSGTWTLTSTAATTVWDTSTTTNLTVSPSSSTIKITGSTTNTRTFAGGSLTYANLWFSNATASGRLNISGSNTFVDLKCDTPPQTLGFANSSTTTVDTFNVNGTAGNLITLVNF